jgi:hypothetical protein
MPSNFLPLTSYGTGFAAGAAEALWIPVNPPAAAAPATIAETFRNSRRLMLSITSTLP